MTPVKLQLLSGFDAETTARAERCRLIIERGVNSDAFQRAVLDASFLDVRQERADGTLVTKLSSHEILDIILSGAEVSTPDQIARPADGIITIPLSLYSKRRSSAIGHHDGGVVHTRVQALAWMEDVEVAGHWMHEWMHVAGFEHDYRNTRRRAHSVPYLIGELLVETAVGAA